MSITYTITVLQSDLAAFQNGEPVEVVGLPDNSTASFTADDDAVLFTYEQNNTFVQKKTQPKNWSNTHSGPDKA